MTAPDAGPATTDGAPAGEDVLVANGASLHGPGQPPGGTGPTGPNIVAAYPSNPGVETDETPVDAEQVPTQAENKAAWVDHAVARGMSRSDADAATKADLVEKYGA